MEGQACSVQPGSKLDLKMYAGEAALSRSRTFSRMCNALPCQGLLHGGRSGLSLALGVPGRKISPKNATGETGKIKGLSYFQLGHFMMCNPPCDLSSGRNRARRCAEYLRLLELDWEMRLDLQLPLDSEVSPSPTPRLGAQV